MGSPQKNVGHFSTKINSLDSILEQIKSYKDTENHTGKSKFAVIEKISKIPASEKISLALKKILDAGEEPGEVLISLFPDLNRDEVATIKTGILQFLADSNGENCFGI